MYYEKAKNTNTDRQFIESFGGLNHALRIADNEFYDIQNMSSENYPLLSSRRTFVSSKEYDSTKVKRGVCYNDNKVWWVYEDEGDLASDSHTLTVNGAITASTTKTITFFIDVPLKKNNFTPTIFLQ